MTDDDLITHLSVGNLDDPEPEPSPKGNGCWYLLIAILFGVLYLLI